MQHHIVAIVVFDVAVIAYWSVIAVAFIVYLVMMVTHVVCMHSRFATYATW